MQRPAAPGGDAVTCVPYTLRSYDQLRRPRIRPLRGVKPS
jgi:hypothetical protein